MMDKHCHVYIWFKEAALESFYELMGVLTPWTPSSQTALLNA